MQLLDCLFRIQDYMMLIMLFYYGQILWPLISSCVVLRTHFLKLLLFLRIVPLKVQVTERLKTYLLILFSVLGSYNTMKNCFQVSCRCVFFSCLILFKKASFNGLTTTQHFIFMKDTLQLYCNIVLNVAPHKNDGRDCFKFHFTKT